MTQNAELALALTELADAIEANPPPIIGSDISVFSAGGNAIGQSIHVSAGPGGGSGVGERIVVVADRPGQTVIGKRVTVTIGAAGAAAPIATPPSSSEQVDSVINQLRTAADSLKTSPSSRAWINGLISEASKWGHAALSGAISGATNALMKSQLGA